MHPRTESSGSQPARESALWNKLPNSGQDRGRFAPFLKCCQRQASQSLAATLSRWVPALGFSTGQRRMAHLCDTCHGGPAQSPSLRAGARHPCTRTHTHVHTGSHTHNRYTDTRTFTHKDTNTRRLTTHRHTQPHVQPHTHICIHSHADSQCTHVPSYRHRHSSTHTGEHVVPLHGQDMNAPNLSKSLHNSARATQHPAVPDRCEY